MKTLEEYLTHNSAPLSISYELVAVIGLIITSKIALCVKKINCDAKKQVTLFSIKGKTSVPAMSMVGKPLFPGTMDLEGGKHLGND